MPPLFTQNPAFSRANPRTARWPGFLLVFLAWFCALIIRWLFKITAIPTAQNITPRREPTRRFAFWKLGLCCVLLMSQQVNGQLRLSPGKTHSDHVQLPADQCSLRSQSVAKLAHPALTKQPGPRHPWRVRSSALEPVAPKRALSPSKRNAILMGTLTYDGEGAVVSQTDARGNATAFEYDAAGRKIKATLAPIAAGDAAQVMSWTYTLGDQVASHIDGSGKTRTFTYDTRNRKLTEVDGLNQSTSMTYDLRDLLTRKTPPNGKYASFKYDGAGALTEYKDWNDKVTSYQYDLQGNRSQMTDALLRVTNWTYGRANRLITHKLPETTPGRSYIYDLNGNLTSETTENGAVLANTYDALNRKVSMSSSSTSVALPGEVVSTTYDLDANGNILTITETLADNSTKTETRTYDVEGRLTSVTDRNGKARNYAYDAADNRTSETDHEPIAVTHTYDARNRLASTTTPELGVTSYLYDGANRLLETSYANLAKEVRAYDLAGQLLSLNHVRAGGTLHSELYEYDASGNRKKLTQSDGTATRITTYTVDHADRLLTELNPDERLEDTLDVVGNRTQRLVKNGAGTLVKTITYSVNARDQVTQVQEKNAAGVVTSTETYGFDANGNRISRVNGAVTTAYLYDRRNRQLGSGASRFELNDGDVRTARIEGGNRTEMVMEGLKLQAEITGGVTAAKYRWGLQLIGEKRGGLVKTILQDSLRSPLIIADQTGAISDRVRYTAAGEVRQRSGSSPLAFGFGGYLAQSGTDELYAFARTYAPGMGRFNESDPLRTFDPMMGMGLHRYVLGYGNSIRYVDPDGRVSFLSDMKNFFDENSEHYASMSEDENASALSGAGAGVGMALNEIGAAPFRAMNYLSNVGADWAGRAAPHTFGTGQEQAADDFNDTFAAAEAMANAVTSPEQTRQRVVATIVSAAEGDPKAVMQLSAFATSLAVPVAAGRAAWVRTPTGRAHVLAEAIDGSAPVAFPIAATPTHAAPLAAPLASSSLRYSSSVRLEQSFADWKPSQLGGAGAGANSAVANSAAIRAKVLSNIADSQTARAGSNFGQFIKNEGKLQESLGIWPPNGGGYSPIPNVTLDVGSKIDRYGFPGGNFVSPQGASFGERALPSAYQNTKPYFQYEVVQSIPGVTQAKVLPWFGQPGMGTQFQLPETVEWYLKNGYLK